MTRWHRTIRSSAGRKNGGTGTAAALPFALLLAAAAPLAAQPVTQRDIDAGLANGSRWLTYSGDYSGRRHSPLTEITPANAPQLAAQWTFQTGISGQHFEASPIVVDGVMYITGPENAAWAIDGHTGRQLWRYQRSLPPSAQMRVCCGNVNRGFAIQGNRLFMETLDAHLVALDRESGRVLWDVEIAKPVEGYSGTGAPLVIGDKVLVGVAGGEFTIRGLIDAYDVTDGHRVWRFWTVPAPGEPGSDTWPRELPSWERGGGPTWLTGTHDPALGLVYWTTGNPNPDYYGDDRKGDNLYTNSLVALDVQTGALRWHYQFTPHDEHDWDANQLPVLADVTFQGQPRKVVMVANRNGFFYVLDRTSGRFLSAFPFVRQTWADRIGSDGKPVERPDQRPTAQGTMTCPDLYGGTNFMSPSYDPALGLFFVTAREVCQIYISQAPPPNSPAGVRTMGGGTRTAQGEPRFGALRAIDPLTGATRWEVRYDLPGWAGVLSTASGVVFSGDNAGTLLAVESRTGRVLWRYQTGSPIYAPPITYSIDGRQYVAIGSGSTFTAFALPRP